MEKRNFFGILNSLQPACGIAVQGSEKTVWLVFGNNFSFISTSISERKMRSQIGGTTSLPSKSNPILQRPKKKKKGCGLGSDALGFYS